MQRYVSVRVTATALFAFSIATLLHSPPVWAKQYALLTIYNDTHVAITELYDRKPGQTYWGINDLTSAVEPGHSFYIRMEQNSYAKCPGIYLDVKLVFANGIVKTLPRVPACNIDVHIHKP